MAIQSDDRPAPVDYRDFITNSTYKHETEKHVSKIRGQSPGVESTRIVPRPSSQSKLAECP